MSDTCWDATCSKVEILLGNISGGKFRGYYLLYHAGYSDLHVDQSVDKFNPLQIDEKRLNNHQLCV